MGKQRYTAVDNTIWEWLGEHIGHKELAVFTHICHRANPTKRDGFCFQGLDSMAEQLQMDRHALQRTLKNLTECGLLERRRAKHAPTKYRPADPFPIPSEADSSTGGKPPIETTCSTGAKPPIEDSSTGGKPPTSTGGKPPTNNLKINKEPKGSVSCPQNGPDLVRYFCAKSEAKTGTKYAPAWSKDGAQFKRLVDALGAEEVRQRLDTFFDGWWAKHWQSNKGMTPATINDFVQNVNRIAEVRQVSSYRTV